MGWYLLNDAAWYVSVETVWHSDWYPTNASINAAVNVAMYAAWHAVGYDGWYYATAVARHAARNYVTVANVSEYLLELKLTDPADINKYAYQIAECLMLRNIDKALCLKIHSIVKEHDLEDITFQLPVDTNPRIMQFRELYQNEPVV